MHISVQHSTSYRYEPGAQRLGLRLRLFPASFAFQAVRSWSLKINDEPVKPFLTNGFGDAEGLWFADRAVEEVEIFAEGVVETLNESGVLGRVGQAPPGLFIRETELTAPDAAIRELADTIDTNDVLASLHRLNERLNTDIAYKPGTTSADTTAAEALAQGTGVCQDLAHVFISTARAVGIPARYVVGYLHDAQAPISETHGWAETHLDGLGWVGFDPTHIVSPSLGYVRLCSGLDARDAAPLRGSFLAGTTESLSVSVAISDIEAQQQ